MVGARGKPRLHSIVLFLAGGLLAGTSLAGVAPAAAQSPLQALCDEMPELGPLCDATSEPPVPTDLPGDGFVGFFTLPTGGSAPVPAIVWSGGAIEVRFGAREFAEGAWGLYTGPLTLYAQRDCGSLHDVLIEAIDCQSTLVTVASDHLESGPGGDYQFTLKAADLADAMVPLDVLHFFVETPDLRYSHYNQPKDLVNAADSTVADAMEEGTFTPVLLLFAEQAGTLAGDDFVAAFGLPTLGPLPAGAPIIAWDGADITVTVTAQKSTGSAWVPYEGPLHLYAQRDCGGLEPLLADSGLCQATLESVASDPGHADATGAATFVLPASELQEAAMEPLDVLHLFVETPDLRYSHYNLAKEALVGDSPDVADALEGVAFTPVLLATGGVPSDGAGGDGRYAQWGASLQKTIGNLQAGQPPYVLKYQADGGLRLDGQLFTADGTDYLPAGTGMATVFIQVDCGGLTQVPEAGSALCGGAGVQGQVQPAMGDVDGNGRFEVTFPAGSLAHLFLPADGVFQSLGAVPVNVFVIHSEWAGESGGSWSSFNAASHILFGASDGQLGLAADLLSDLAFTPLLLPPPPGLGLPTSEGGVPDGDGAYAQWGGTLAKAVANLSGRTVPYMLHYQPEGWLRLDGVAYDSDGAPVGEGDATVYLEVDCGGIAEAAPDLCDGAGVRGQQVARHSATNATGFFQVLLSPDDLQALFAGGGVADSGYVPVNLFVTHSAWSAEGPEQQTLGPAAVYSHFNAASQAAFGAAGPDAFAVADALSDLAFTPLLLPKPPVLAPLGQVTQLNAAAHESLPQVALNWLPVPDAQTYLVQRSTSPSMSPFVAWETSDTQAVDEDGLLTGTTYHYTVSARSGPRSGPPSAAVSATTAGEPDLEEPGQVPGVSATSLSATRIVVEWGAATDDRGVTAYKVYRVNIDDSLTQLVEVGGLSWVNEGLTPSTPYSYLVRAVDAAGNMGPDSLVATATTLEAVATPPAESGAGAGAGSGAGTANQPAPVTVSQTATSTSTRSAAPGPVAPPAQESPASPAPQPPTQTPSAVADPATEAVEPAALATYNAAIGLVVERSGETNIVRWVLPEQPPAALAGVQVWRSNSPYVLVGTFDSDSEEFSDGRFADESGDAKPSTKYLVTAYFGLSKALGFYGDEEAPPEDSPLGAAASSGTVAERAGPPWALVVLVWMLAAALVVLLVVHLSRGRGRKGGDRTA